MNEQKIKTKIKEIMANNHRKSGDYEYTVPAPIEYPFQWFWDSCFHAIILRHFDVEMAKKELISLTSRQSRNGMLPHMIYWEDPRKYKAHNLPWGRYRTSSIIQPPILAYAVWAIYEKDHDKKFLKKMYTIVKKYHKYYFKYRDPHNHHLVGIINPDESGEDNSPRFDKVLKLGPDESPETHYNLRNKLVDYYREQRFRIKKYMERLHWVRDVPINAIFVSALKYEAKMAKELGKISNEMKAYRRSEDVTRAMRKYMLGEDGVMSSTMGLNYHHIKVKTWAIFSPMFAGILTREEAENIVNNHLKNEKEFKAPYGVPTVSMDEETFNPEGFWRGPVWISTNWFIYKGLLNYGFKKEAKAVLKDSLKLIEKGGFREQYNPITGEPLGAKQFTWSGLVLDMLNDELDFNDIIS